MTGKESILARSHDLVNVDCMGSLHPVTSFCEKEYKEVDYLVRGFTDSKSDQAYCIFSSQAILKWECPTKGAFNCQVQAKTECENLKPIYASSLKVFKAYYAEEGPDKILNCVYNGAKITKYLKQSIEPSLEVAYQAILHLQAFDKQDCFQSLNQVHHKEQR